MKKHSRNHSDGQAPAPVGPLVESLKSAFLRRVGVIENDRRQVKPGDELSPLESARAYHARGWSIIPITAGTKKTPCKWTTYQQQPATEKQLTKWFGNGKPLGVAVILGDVSGGLVCRDFDAMASYKRWASQHPELARTLPTVPTARGRHVYFRAADVDLRFVDLGDGEYRGDSGHYCLLPPSRHPDGPIYRWLIPLPAGPIPLIEDVCAAGFLESCTVTERTECTERTETTEENRGLQKQWETNALENAIENAIVESLPTMTGRRNRQVFELARALKAVPLLADASVDRLQSHVRRWHDLGVQKGVIATEPFEETWIDFLTSWPKVKFPKGAEPMSKVFELA